MATMKAKKVAKTTRAPREDSAAFIIRKLIADGHSNEAIFKVLKKRRVLDDSKKHWPAWYRRQMKLEPKKYGVTARFVEQHAE